MEVDIEEFGKLDLRIGEIVSAEEVKGSDKLIKLEVDIGELRQVVAGVREWYDPKELVGKKVVLLANIEPIKLFGIESKGMILAAQDEKTVSILTVDREVKRGAKIR